jgi:hypothetical protein
MSEYGDMRVQVTRSWIQTNAPRTLTYNYLDDIFNSAQNRNAANNSLANVCIRGIEFKSNEFMHDQIKCVFIDTGNRPQSYIMEIPTLDFVFPPFTTSITTAEETRSFFPNIINFLNTFMVGGTYTMEEVAICPVTETVTMIAMGGDSQYVKITFNKQINKQQKTTKKQIQFRPYPPIIMPMPPNAASSSSSRNQ